MKIAFNPSTVAALIAPPNNKDITFDLRGHNIFARGVKFCGTDTNTWRDIKINNVSIDSNILDLRDGDNTTLTNINGVVTVNSTWRPVVDNLTSDSTTSSLSANLGRVLKYLIDGKSDSEHTHDDRYLRLTGGWMSGDINFGDDNKIYWGRNTDSASISFKNDGDGDADSYMSFVTSDNGNEYFRWSHSSGSTNTEWMALRSDGLRVGGTKVSLEGHSHNDLYYTKTEVNNKLNDKSDTGHNHDDRYLKLTGGTISGRLLVNSNSNSYTTPSIAINYYDSYTVNDYSITQIKMGNPKYDMYLGLSPTVKGYYGKIGYFMHANTDCEFLWGTSGWIKRMALECSSGNLWVSGSITASSFIGNASTATNADTVDGEHASNFSYTHQSSFDFSKIKSGRIVTFDQSDTDYGWINGFASTHNNYLTSVIFNTHRTSNWYVGYIEGSYATGLTNGLLAVHKLAFVDLIPSSLKNPHALTISLNGTSQGPYDGSAAKNINITPSSIGAATSDHNHDGRYVYNYGGTANVNGLALNQNALFMSTTSGITEDWWHILQAAWNDEYRWNSLIAFPTLNRNGMYYRSGLDDNTKWGSWVKLLDIGNSYVTKGKGVINGTTITQVDNATNATNADVASKVYGQVGDTGTHELVRCDMNNDQFRIIAGSNGNNNGWAEIATADDGNEPIYVRQYTGVFSSVVRTLTLLDANGYTHFPSYINIGGNENNNSSPDRVWGSNGSDSYLRSYRTSALNVNYANNAGNADTLDGYHANGGSNSAPYGRIPTIESDGVMEVGKYIDFHNDNSGTYDFSTRLETTGNYGNSVYLPSNTGTLALISDNVASATKLQTPRSIWGQSFDGTRDVNGTIYINNSDSSNGAIRLNNDVNSNARISAISDQVIFNTGNAIRFGETSWDWNQWAGLKYTHSNKTIYLGIADNSIFNANSTLSGGTLKFPGITTITTNPGARIGNSGGDLYLGNANNSAWLKVQDICSQQNSNNWCIYQNGTAYFNSIGIETDATIDGNLEAGQIIRGGSGLMWVNGRNGALLRETSVSGYHTLWSLKTTDGSWDFGEYNAGSDWDNVPVLSYITDSNYNSGNNTPTYQIRFPLASGTVALTSDIPNPNNYYWANVKISTSPSITTSPTVSNLTATSSIKMGNISLEHTDEINNITNGNIYLNFRNSGNVSLCYGGGKVGIGTATPLYELDVMGNTFTAGFGIRPYYLSNSGLLSTISPGDGYTYRCLEIGKSVAISCIIADRVVLSNERGVLIKFNTGFDGLIVLLKDLLNYGDINGNGYFWVMPSGCKIIRPDGSSILINLNLISNAYDDGKSRFFVYSYKYDAWIEFYCG